MIREMKNKLKTNRDNIKIFFIAFFAFLAANYLYNNIITKSTASNIKFRDVEVKVTGEIKLDLVCDGEINPNPSSKKRGLGESTKNNCKGFGTFNAILPQQRFVQNP